METLLSSLAFAAFIIAQVAAVIAVSADQQSRLEVFGTTHRNNVSRLVPDSRKSTS